MAQTIIIKRGLKANLPALAAGEFGLCTDTKEVFIGDGSSNIFVGRTMMGTYAARPNAGAAGRLYYVNSGTNLGYIYADDGTTWQRVNALTLSDLTGSLDDIDEGTTYGKVKKSELVNGQVKQISDGTNTVTPAALNGHMNNSSIHRIIDDAHVSNTDLWSSQKIQNEIELAKRGIEYQDSVKDKDLATPPTTPTAKDRYIVKATATGAWVGKENNIAEWNGYSWVFYAPSEGWTVYVDDEDKQYSFNGTGWVMSGAGLQTVTAGNGLTGGGQSDSVTLNVGAGNGITVATDSVAVKAYKGITVDANGVSVNIDGTSLIYDSANGNRLTIATVDGGTF